MYQKAKDGESELVDFEMIIGKPYLLVRRHHTIDSLVVELQKYNFKIKYSNTGEEWGALKVAASVA